MIQLSEKAVGEIKRIQQKNEKNQVSWLRMKVVGGGCSGMSYKMDFEQESPTEQDETFEQDGIKVVVDKKSLLFLKGTTLEFSDGLNGKGFEFSNPNATKTCGCGSSFSA